MFGALDCLSSFGIVRLRSGVGFSTRRRPRFLETFTQILLEAFPRDFIVASQ